MGILDIVKPGVLTGTEVRKVFEYGRLLLSHARYSNANVLVSS